MPRGRKAQPDHVAEAKGNPGRRKRKSVLFSQNYQPGKAPQHLTDAARRVWERIEPELSHLRFIKRTDYSAFERYCVHLADWWDLTADIETHGKWVITKSEHVEMARLHPSFMARERIEKHLVELEDRFGLNPVSRQQLLQRMIAEVPVNPQSSAPSSDGETKEPSLQLDQPQASAIGFLSNAGQIH